MRAKSRLLRWLTAIAVLMVTAYACVAAQARSADDLVRFHGSHFRSDKYRKSSLDTLSWERQRRKVHRRSESARASPAISAKPKSGKSARRVSKKAARSATVSVENVPLPLPRPPFWPEPHSFAEAAGPGFDTASVTSALSDCDQRLAEIADIELLPRLIGPGECGGRDLIRLNAVLVPNRKRVEVRPTAVLRCAMAESFAAWLRDEASDYVTAMGDALRSVDTYGSYECRGRNWVADAKLSEHGKGNAIDLRALVLADGRHITFTDETVSKTLRDDLRDSACHRFTTVLGPGADGHHNDHIHLDGLERNDGARIEIQTVTAGPWAIGPNYKASKLQSCTMSRSDGELGITFVRARDGLSLILESKKWKFDRDKSYPVRLTAGS